MGLDYSDVADSVMYIKNNKDKQTLHEDDIRQIQTLYGSANNDFSDETIYFIESLVDDTESYLLSNSKEKQWMNEMEPQFHCNWFESNR